MEVSQRVMMGLLAILLWAGVGGAVADKGQLADTGIEHLRQAAPQRYVSPQPSDSQFEALAEAGVGHIINLRPRSEQDDFDEAERVRSLGMQYHHLAVAGKADISFANARKLDTLLQQVGEAPTLLHCATGNRVGALIALRASLQGAALEEAVAQGQAWGLSSLEPVVRERLRQGPPQ